jgi:single-strand DNA-binding protein
MTNMNIAIGDGYVAREPTITETDNGKIARLTIGQTTHYKSGEEFKERTTFNTLDVYDQFKVAKIEKSVHKGTHVQYQGAVETRQWDDNGSTRYTTSIVLRPGACLLNLLDVTAKEKPAQDAAPDLRTAAGQRQQQQQYRHEQ